MTDLKETKVRLSGDLRGRVGRVVAETKRGERVTQEGIIAEALEHWLLRHHGNESSVIPQTAVEREAVAMLLEIIRDPQTFMDPKIVQWLSDAYKLRAILRDK